MHSKNSIYTGFEFESDGHEALAIINSDLKKLPDKNLYAYAVFIVIVPDSILENGQPGKEEYEYLIDIENRLIEYLENETRTVHVGHTSLYKKTEIIFYTKDAAIVEDYLEHFLPTIEREFQYEVEEDRSWENVAAFYELL